MNQRKLNYSFLPGTQKVSKENYNNLKSDLMKVLGCQSSQYYYRKRKCIPNIAAHQKEAVENIFAKYGITDTSEIWEITEAVKNEQGCTINKT